MQRNELFSWLKHQLIIRLTVNKRMARIASIIVILVGCLVLVGGWGMDLTVFKSIAGDAAEMKANTSFCFILAGVSLGLQTRKRRNYGVAKGLAIAVSAIGILTLSQYLFGWNLGIDELLFRDLGLQTQYPGRMGDNTALNFALVGLALYLLGQRTRRSDRLVQTATLLAVAIALLALIGYAYNVQVFYQFIVYSTSMALNTSLTFLVLCLGILSIQANRGFIQTLTSNLAGGIVARRLISMAIAVPFILGWLILQGLRANLYDPAFSLGLLVVLLIFTLVLVIWKNAHRLNQLDYDRNRSDDRLRSNKKKLELALTGANQGIWDWDLQTEILTWDDRCKKIFGLPPDFSVTYEWHLNALHPDDRERVFEAGVIAQRDQTEFNEEYRTFHPDGTMHWILALGRGYYDATGEPERMSGTVMDISDRKEAESAFVRTNSILQTVINGTRDVIYVKDLQGRYVLANQAAALWLNRTVESLLGQDDLALFPADVAGQIQTIDQQVIENEEYVTYEEQLLKNNELRSLLSSKYPWRNNQGEVIGIIGISIDLTDLKQAQLNEQFLNELDLRLRQLNNAKAMTWEAVSSLGEYLNVDRCFWHEIDLENRVAIVDRNWRREEDVTDLAGTYPLENFFTSEQFDRLAAGQTIIVPDVTTHPDTAPYAQSYQPLTVAAFVAIPCIHVGRWVANLSINCTTPRNWRDDEVTLLQETVARLWSVIEQTRALQKLYESEERLRLALRAANQGMYDLNVQTGETIVSDEYAQMLGYDPETFVETNAKWRERLHPDDWEPVSKIYEEYIAGDRSEYRVEFRQRSQSGDWKWVLSLGKIIAWDTEGKPLRMLGTHTDISDRKQAEADLQQRNDYIQILYETSRDLLSTYQPLTLIDALFTKLKSLIELDIYFNYLLDEQQQKLHLMFYGGISDETAQSIEWLEIGQAVCGTVAQQQCQIVQPNLQQSTDPKTELVRSLGLTAYSCQPLTAQGKLFGTLGFGSRTRTEFTSAETKLFQAICDRIAIAMERTELVSSLQQQTEELTRANRLKDEFLAALSHELRTPLNPIMGWTKLLQTQKLTLPKTKKALSTIERNVKQQIALVDDLLDVARVVQGQFQLTSQPVDLVPILNAAGDSVSFAAIAKSITLELHYPSDSISQVMGDELRLQQVFWNLLSNAIKFTPDNGRVDVWLEQVQNDAQIRITDTGIGIAAEFLPYVFDRFRQADGSSTRRYGGLGLGLALVKHLVELHGGTVSVESLGEGRGATFKVNLPLLKSASSNLPTSNSQQPQTDLSSSVTSESLTGIRVLVVDDEPDNLDLLDFVLKQEGAIVTTVNYATEALAIIAENPPDILISDIGMPDMDGYELLRQVRALPSQQNKPLKAIALTAFAQQEDRERMLTAGFQAYLSKPCNLVDLITAIALEVGNRK